MTGPEKLLENMTAVGAVTDRSARIWIRAARPGRIRLRWWRCGDDALLGEKDVWIDEDNSCDNTCAVEIGGRENGESSLVALQRYRYSVQQGADHRTVGEGRFETAPQGPQDMPGHVSIAVMSCNQPFRNDGRVREEAEQMLSAVQQCFRRNHTKMAFMVGDQIYSDMPQPFSLFNPTYFTRIAPPGRNHILDCSFEEIRRIYQRRYRWFWNLEGWQQLRSRYPCYPILDDHDIVDNWGSHLRHREARWQKLGQAARSAYQDYQGSLVVAGGLQPPKSFDFTVSYGNFAAFALDLRSNRRAGADGRIFSVEQEDRLRRFLKEKREAEIVFIVLSVPVVHLPRALARIAARLISTNEDFSDRWSSGAHIRDRDRFLKMIYRHQIETPRQRVVLLSGDIHIGSVHVIQWYGGGPALYQLISSGVTHATGFLIRNGSKAIIRTNRRLRTRDNTLKGKVRFLPGKDRIRNPYGRLNIGLVEVLKSSAGAPANLRFSLYGHHRGEPRCVYRSALIPPEDALQQ